MVFDAVEEGRLSRCGREKTKINSVRVCEEETTHWPLVKMSGLVVFVVFPIEVAGDENLPLFKH